MKEPKTKVAYVLIEGDVVALFPELDWDQQGNITSYMHIGQHGGASPELLQNPKATPEQYADLHEELTEMVGYNLKIIN